MHTSTMAPAFTMRCRDDDEAPPLLEGVQASGRLDGVLFTMTLRQAYRNAGPRPVELLYSFPLPHEAVLLGIAAEFGDHRLEGQVLPRQQAEDVYEKALAEGDAPILLEVAADGLHTASLGNLLPGERVVLELRFAQVLAFEQGRLRLVVPTTIAPRYGQAEAAGVPAHGVPETGLTADYPLTLEVTVTGALAGGRVECPTHAHTLSRTQDGLRLALADGARLDRDVVLTLTPTEPRPDLLVTGRDAQGHRVALAAFQVPPGPVRETVSLALLVDGSGSMAGDSIASARRALQGVVATLGPQDRVSLSRFGSQTDHVLAPSGCTPRAQDRLRRLIDGTEATLGGTEMAQAIRSVFALWPAHGGVDLLLITDGEIWNVEHLVAEARRGGHRVFAIGVGSAPAEGVLRRLADATGGACEFATPGESLQAAAARMAGRIRQVPGRPVRVDWGATPLWHVGPPPGVFAGDTVLAWAGFDHPGPARATLLADDANKAGAAGMASPPALATTAVTVASEGTDLARLGASRRLAGVDEKLALQLALDHQLITARTHCVLVHRRAEEDKPLQPAEVRKLPQMMAAGWGGTGSVHSVPVFKMAVAASMTACDTMAPSTPSVWRSARTAAPGDAAGTPRMDGVEIPAFLRRQANALPELSLADIARQVAQHLEHGGSVEALPAVCGAWRLPAQVVQVIGDLMVLGLAEAEAWLLVAAWIAAQADPGDLASARAMLSRRADAVAPARRAQAWEVIAKALAHHDPSPRLGRIQRLLRALAP